VHVITKECLLRFIFENEIHIEKAVNSKANFELAAACQSAFFFFKITIE